MKIFLLFYFLVLCVHAAPIPAFPPVYDAIPNTSTVQMRALTKGGDTEFEMVHQKFIRHFVRLAQHDAVKKGNLPAEIDLNLEELQWWRDHLITARLDKKNFIDYKGNIYKIVRLASAKLYTVATEKYPGPPHDYQALPENAFREIVFTIELNIPIKNETATKLLNQMIPLFLVSSDFKISPKGSPSGEKLTDPQMLEKVTTFITTTWKSAKISDAISYSLILRDSKAEIYSVTATIDSCKDGWHKNLCKNGNIPVPKWIYFGINIKDNLSLIYLGALSYPKGNPETSSVIKMGDLNSNGYAEFLYLTQDGSETSSSIDEINPTGAERIWGWSNGVP
jgi:hypothetical protein